MCESTVYMERDGQREKVMEDVIRLEPTKAGVVLSKLFEPPQTVQGVIREIDFLKHAVTLVPIDEGR
ncbi:MAG: CooT family nickel-binding protein [Anaerolineales bacterium]|nr:CooT family nickel-binding protein [Anaerolineales bacterium]